MHNDAAPALNNISQGLVKFDLLPAWSSATSTSRCSVDAGDADACLHHPGVLDQLDAPGGFRADDVEAYRADLLAAVAQETSFNKITTCPTAEELPSSINLWRTAARLPPTRTSPSGCVPRKKSSTWRDHDAVTNLPNRMTFSERIQTALSRTAALGYDCRAQARSRPFQERQRYARTSHRGLIVEDGGRPHARLRAQGEHLVARLGGYESAIVQVPSAQSSDRRRGLRASDRGGRSSHDLDGHQVIIGVEHRYRGCAERRRQARTVDEERGTALYRAKADGGGVYRFFEFEMDAPMQVRRAIELDLRMDREWRVRAVLSADRRR